MVTEEIESAAPVVASDGGVVTRVLATIGAVALFVVAGASVFQFVSSPAKDCVAQGQSRIVCAAGSVGLLDLAALGEKDRRIEALSAELATKTGAVTEAEKRAGDLETRVKELDGAVAAAKTTAADVERLRGEIAKRDARIAELTDKLAAATRKPEPAPGARTPAPGTPTPKPAPKP